MASAEVKIPRSLDLMASAGERTVAVADRLRTNPGRRRRILVKRLLISADLLGLLVAFLLSEVLASLMSESTGFDALHESLWLLIGTPIWVALGHLHRLYDTDATQASNTAVDDFNGVFHTVTVGTWGVYAGVHLTRIAEPDLTKVVIFWLLAIVSVMTARAVARASFRRNETFHQNAVVVGAGSMGQLIARKLHQHPEFGVNVVGFLDDDPRALRGDLGEMRVIGSVDDLLRVVDSLGVERVIVAFDRDTDGETLEALRPLEARGVQIDIIPRLFDLFGPNVGYSFVDGLPILLLRSRSRRRRDLVKNVFDVVIAGMLLVLAAPLMLVIALWVRKDSVGPIFFRQERVGRDCKPFTMLKFRTMVTGTSSDEHRAYIARTSAAGAELGANGLYKLDRSDAVTRSGRFLRRTSLDELPQLFNVLRGEMSIIGPRPCLEYEVEMMEAHHRERFSVRPGLTGLWQVTARGNASFREALDLDLAYVRSQSFSLDVKILFLTPLQMLRGTATR